MSRAKGRSLATFLPPPARQAPLGLSPDCCIWEGLGQSRPYTQALKGSLSYFWKVRTQVNSSTGSEGEMMLANHPQL